MKTAREINQKGFSLPHVILLLVILGSIAAIGWYVIKQNKSSDNLESTINTNNSVDNVEVAKIPVYERTTSVPVNWKTYARREGKFSFSYPEDWSISGDTVDYEEVPIWVYPKGSENPQYSLSTYKQTLEEAIIERKKNVTENPSSNDGIKLTILEEQKYLFDGRKAVLFKLESDDGTSVSYSTEFYIEANDRIYFINTGFHEKDIFNGDVLTMFESLQIQ